jgi:16S rRNA (guanine1207-N2)-methyltransferase
VSQPASHYFLASRDETGAPQNVRQITVRAAGSSLPLLTGAGVFARSGLDAGSRLLIETALHENAYPAGGRLCDLGCGWGPVGCCAARLLPQTQVLLCDINPRAAQLAALNVARNDLSNARVWCGDGLDALRAGCLDAVLCNPPVRAGNAVIGKLFADAQRCLKQDGVLWVVLRTAQGAKSWQKKLAAQFGDCRAVAIDGGYRVLQSVS